MRESVSLALAFSLARSYTCPAVFHSTTLLFDNILEIANACIVQMRLKSLPKWIGKLSRLSLFLQICAEPRSNGKERSFKPYSSKTGFALMLQIFTHTRCHILADIHICTGGGLLTLYSPMQP